MPITLDELVKGEKNSPEFDDLKQWICSYLRERSSLAFSLEDLDVARHPANAEKDLVFVAPDWLAMRHALEALVDDKRIESKGVRMDHGREILYYRWRSAS